MYIQDETVSKKPPVWNTLWFLWLTTTVLYLIIFMTYGISYGIADLLPFRFIYYPLTISVIGVIVGLFVPFGLYNFTMLYGQSPLLLLMFAIILVLMMVYNNKMLKSFVDRPRLKFFINLFILVLLTLVVDLLLWGDWRSLLILYGGFH